MQGSDFYLVIDKKKKTGFDIGVKESEDKPDRNVLFLSFLQVTLGFLQHQVSDSLYRGQRSNQLFLLPATFLYQRSATLLAGCYREVGAQSKSRFETKPVHHQNVVIV